MGLKKIIFLITLTAFILNCSDNVPNKSQIESIILADDHSHFEVKKTIYNNKTLQISLLSNKLDFFKQTRYIDFQFLYYSLNLINNEQQFNIKYDIKYLGNDSTNMDIYFSAENIVFYKTKYDEVRLSKLVKIFNYLDFIKMDNIIKLKTSTLPNSFDGKIHEILKISLTDANNILFEKHLNTLFYIYITDKEFNYFKNKSELASKIERYWDSLNLGVSLKEYDKKFQKYIKSKL